MGGQITLNCFANLFRRQSENMALRGEIAKGFISIIWKVWGCSLTSEDERSFTLLIFVIWHIEQRTPYSRIKMPIIRHNGKNMLSNILLRHSKERNAGLRQCDDVTEAGNDMWDGCVTNCVTNYYLPGSPGPGAAYLLVVTWLSPILLLSRRLRIPCA